MMNNIKTAHIIILIFLLGFINPIKIFASESDSTGVLFIGNSLISYYESMPNMVDSLGELAGHKTFVSDVSVSGTTIEDNLKNETVLNEIREGVWNFVVLAFYDGFFDGTYETYSYPWIQMMCDTVAKYNPDARVVLTLNMTFDYYVILEGATGRDDPDWSYYYNNVSKRILQGVQDLAKSSNAIIAPLGEVWKVIHEIKFPELVLVGNDNIHLNKYGAYIYAATVFTSIFLDDPTELEYIEDLNTDTCRVIRQEAGKTVLNNLAKWNITLSNVPINDDYKLKIKTFPNPSSGNFIIELPEDHKSNRVRIFNASNGASILNKKAHDERELLIDGSIIPSGLYIIQIINDNGTYTGKHLHLAN